MKAIGVYKYGPPSNLTIDDIPEPGEPGDRDLLVEVKAMSVNPIDCKVRAGTYDDAHDFYGHVPKPFHVIGPDGAGVVLSVGPGVKYYKPGDKIFYECFPIRQGAATERHIVDERLAGHLPSGWDLLMAACLPITAGTAYEALYERLEIKQDEQAALLIINGAGGVGSMASQIARNALRLPVVITTAGRLETQEWTKKMGATHVLNHHKDLQPQLEALNLTVPVKYIFIIHNTAKYLKVVAELAAPMGKVCSIVQAKGLDFYDTQSLSKSLTFSWCWLGSKQYHQADVESQHFMMKTISEWASSGTIKSHLKQRLKLTKEGLVRGHEMIESGKTVGKIGLGVEEEGQGQPFE
ncbi:quinone oxidoreductase [Myriangium duriaei CBS 260.36]|uniref:Quinone oxidoreductase n=1 Tax=Myriangium duriaei CBS 260.36 TaxID=1168546 RepID=A0A9P4JB06_9PEZI|nr:quinone oxidoreductase [Myriangium duriaei CBS 260.36]